MKTRIVRTLVSLGVVLTTYLVYAVAAVPLIEPAVVLTTSPGHHKLPPPGPREPGPVDPDFAAWFEPGSWELDKPMVFRMSTGILLLQDYQRLGDGTVRIKPCTMVLVSDAENDELRRRRAVILRADEGATLRFDKFDTDRAAIGQLAGGTIHGEVRIRSDQQSPGPEDDLFISTRDVQVSEQQIWTHNPVWYHFGPHNGSARGLRIGLTTASGDGVAKIAGVKTIELAREVKMRLFLPRNRRGGQDTEPAAGGVFGMFAGSGATTTNQPIAAESPSAAQPLQQVDKPVADDGIPVDVECVGPFLFDVEQLRATFKDDVKVVGRTGEKHNDELTCQELSLFFVRDTLVTAAAAGATADADAVTTAASENDSGFPKLRPSRLEARGNPVMFVSPSTSIIAVGKYLEYDLDTSAGVLKGEPAAELKQQGSSTIQAPELRFVTNSSGDLVSFVANGAGFMRREAVDGNDGMIARWQTQAAYEPHEGENRLSLIGNVHVDIVRAAASRSATPGGSIATKKLYVWFLPADDSAPRGLGQGSGQSPERGPIAGIGGGTNPTRLLAEGNVVINFDQLQGDFNRAEMWFKQTTVPGGGALAGAAGTHGGQSGQLLTQPTRQPGPPRRRPLSRPETGNLKVSGGKLQVEFAIGGERPIPTNVRVFGRETDALPTPNGGVGNIAGVQPATSGRGMAVLTGDNFSLAGPVIEMTPPASRALVDGAGTLSYRVEKGLDGQNIGTPDWVEVRWSDRIRFDGRVAHVTGNVEARLTGGRLRCQQMDLVFSEHVNLAALDGGQNKPELSEIICRGGVELHQLEHDEVTGELTSVQRIHAVNLTLEQVSGDFRADGPGWAVVIGSSLGEAGGLAGRMGRPAAPPAAAPPNTAGAGDMLDYIGLEFQYGVSGNLRRNESTFTGKVVTIYGEVTSWDTYVDPDDFEQLGDGGYRMECDRLDLVEMRLPDGEKWVEMVARGSTRVEGRQFTGKAAQIRYDGSKDMLTLEGDGRSGAMLFLQQSVGGQPNQIRARKLQYSPTTHLAKIIDFDSLELNQIQRPPQAQSPPQQPQRGLPQQQYQSQGYPQRGYPPPAYSQQPRPGQPPLGQPTGQSQLGAPLRRSAGVPAPTFPQ